MLSRVIPLALILYVICSAQPPETMAALMIGGTNFFKTMRTVIENSMRDTPPSMAGPLLLAFGLLMVPQYTGLVALFGGVMLVLGKV